MGIEDPEGNAPGFHRKRLRGTHENSICILLRIPIKISNSAHDEEGFSLIKAQLSSILPLSPGAIARLQDVRLIRSLRPTRAKRLPIDYVALQQTYRRMLAEGPYANQTELARHLGVSRVWVSKVLKGINRDHVRGCSPLLKKEDTVVALPGDDLSGHDGVA